MVINYCGEKCFKIQSGKVSLVVDPLPRFKGDITLLTGSWKEMAKEYPPVAGQIYGPGEYEMLEVGISGWPMPKTQTAYTLIMEEIRLCFLGDGPSTSSGQAAEIDPSILEKLGEVDILFAPAGISAKSIKQIQPKIVIPFYKKPDALKEFLKEMEKKVEPEEKLVIKKKEITPGMKVVVLKA